MIEVQIPGWGDLRLATVVFDLNGTLTDRGELGAGVAERIALLRERVTVQLASADTYGTAVAVSRALDIELCLVPTPELKLELVEQLGATATAHVGNGSNDVAALAAAALGIAVLGTEGLSAAALAAADIVCSSPTSAIDLLLDPRALVSTLRS